MPGEDPRVSRRRFLSGVVATGAFAGSSRTTGVAAGAVRCPDRPDALTPRRSASNTSNRTTALLGSMAPRHRRGRNALIGVSASRRD